MNQFPGYGSDELDDDDDDVVASPPPVPPASFGTWLGQLFDRWLLRDVDRRVRALPDRAAFLEHATLFLERHDGARVLLASEHPAAALRLAAEGFVTGLQAVRIATPAPPIADAEALRRLGARPDELADIEAAGRALGLNRDLGLDAPMFLRDAEVTERGHACLDRVLLGSRTLERRLRPLALRPAQVRRRQVARVAAVLLGLTAIVIGALYEDRTAIATASGTFDEGKFGAHHAIDGDATTEWLLPSRTAGFIDVRFAPRKITSVKLLNARNPPFDDRGSRTVRVEFHAGGKLLSSVPLAFPVTAAHPQWVQAPVSVAAVETLRIVVDDYHRSGGGLAEIVWE